MNVERLEQLALLIAERNATGAKITAIIARPAQIGHLGEFIAAEVFDIALEQSAINKGFDGRFRSGTLVGKTVDVKWYAKREGIVDLRLDDIPDYYLVLTGPRTKVMTSRCEERPWILESVFLFDAHALIGSLRTRGLRIGIATSVAREHWQSAEVFPRSTGGPLDLSPVQRAALGLFSFSGFAS